MVLTDLTTVLLSNTTDSSCGTTRWMSPELLDMVRFDSDGLPSRESDCYALGMTIYEVSYFLSFWNHMTYPSSGTQWPCAIPSPTVSRSCVCDTQGGASGEASERRISGFRRRPVGAVAIVLERVGGSATDCPAVARLSSLGLPYLGASKIVSR